MLLRSEDAPGRAVGGGLCTFQRSSPFLKDDLSCSESVRADEIAAQRDLQWAKRKSMKGGREKGYFGFKQRPAG